MGGAAGGQPPPEHAPFHDKVAAAAEAAGTTKAVREEGVCGAAGQERQALTEVSLSDTKMRGRLWNASAAVGEKGTCSSIPLLYYVDTAEPGA